MLDKSSAAQPIDYSDEIGHAPQHDDGLHAPACNHVHKVAGAGGLRVGEIRLSLSCGVHFSHSRVGHIWSKG